MTMIKKIKITCGECSEKFFVYIKSEKIKQITEIEIYIHFICSNCGTNITENKVIT